MTITVDAIYENGVLRLSAPLPLPEHQKVQVQVLAEPNWTEQTSGIIGWKGDHDSFERLLRESRDDFLETAWTFADLADSEAQS